MGLSPDIQRLALDYLNERAPGSGKGTRIEAFEAGYLKATEAQAEALELARARIGELEAGLQKMRDILRSLQPAMNVMAREVMDDIIREQIDALLSPVQTKE